METIDTLIIGAGPAGLTTAYSLAKAGHGVIVIEQDKHYVGGISRTVTYKGFLFDIGGHRFFSKSREVVALWDEILPDDFLVRPRLSRIYYAGKFYAYPLKAFEALRNLGLAQSMACLAYAYARAFPVRDPKTFHHWMRNEFGERLYAIFFKLTPKRCGAWIATTSRRIGLPSKSRGLICSRRSPMASGVPCG